MQKKNPKKQQTHKKPPKAKHKIYFGLLWINERVATIINQIYRVKQMQREAKWGQFVLSTKKWRK